MRKMCYAPLEHKQNKIRIVGGAVNLRDVKIPSGEAKKKMVKEQPKINIKKFILFHKRRINLLRKLLKEKIHGRLIYQISFLGIESLAKLLYPKEKSSEKRFLELLSTTIGKTDAIQMYKFWRCPLTHEGYITDLWTTLEAWGDEDLAFIDFPKTDKIRSGSEYPPGSIIEIYNNLIDYSEDTIKVKANEANYLNNLLLD